MIYNCIEETYCTCNLRFTSRHVCTHVRDERFVGKYNSDKRHLRNYFISLYTAFLFIHLTLDAHTILLLILLLFPRFSSVFSNSLTPNIHTTHISILVVTLIDIINLTPFNVAANLKQ